MGKIIAHQYWLQLTNAGVLAIRGSALRRIDSALEQYHKQPTQSRLEELRQAFADYVRQDPNWIRNPRNRYRAFEILSHDLDGSSTLQLSPAERVAWKMIYEESQNLLQRLFSHQKLEWRTDLVGNLKRYKGEINDTRKLVQNSLTLADKHPSQEVSRLLDEVVPAEVRTVVLYGLEQLMPGILQDAAAAIAPVFGLAHSAGKLLWSVAVLIKRDINLTQGRQHAQQAFSTNEPALATQALLRILENERETAKFKLAVNATAFTAKIASALADGGTVGNAAIGVATSAINLLNLVRVVTIDCLERNAANKLMNAPPITAKVFDECPLIGAYMICCCPASALMNALFENHAVVGWTGRAEYAWKNHWTPLRDLARKVVKEHRFVIKSLEQHPGMLSCNSEVLDMLKQRVA